MHQKSAPQLATAGGALVRPSCAWRRGEGAFRSLRFAGQRLPRHFSLRPPWGSGEQPKTGQLPLGGRRNTVHPVPGCCSRQKVTLTNWRCQDISNAGRKACSSSSNFPRRRGRKHESVLIKLNLSFWHTRRFVLKSASWSQCVCGLLFRLDYARRKRNGSRHDDMNTDGRNSVAQAPATTGGGRLHGGFRLRRFFEHAVVIIGRKEAPFVGAKRTLLDVPA